MKISIQAMLNFGSKGADKVKNLTDRIRENLERAAISANKIDKGLYAPREDMNAGPSQGATYRGQRGVTGARGAEGRNFAGLAGMARSETGGFVAAYATIAANLFAVTAAFQALSNAARTEQLAEGLELVGARAGRALPPVAKNLQAITDNALSYAESMKVVAQATAAGFKQEEIERLGAVARGASVALGRDMTDSIDRLTRGTIKLEPELLDEIGIMTRLDEAVRAYAEANNKTASSLTQTERRQAFLNAVLAEGERKFGDVSEQIDSNPYDKLQASLRDLGTGFLNLLNRALAPVAKLLADMPGLAIVPLLGILTTAASKVLPTIGGAFGKVTDKLDILTEKLKFSTSFIKNASADIESSFFKILGSDPSITKGTNLDLSRMADAVLDDEEVLRNQILQIKQAKKELNEQDSQGNQTQIKQLNLIEQDMREVLGVQRALNAEKKVEKKIQQDLAIQSAMRNRIESVAVELNQGNIFGALGVTFGRLGDDIAEVIGGTAAGGEAASKAWKKLGASVVTTGQLVGSIMTTMTMWFAAAGVAIQLFITFMDSWGTSAEKAYRKASKGLKEYAERAEETLIQIERMNRLGKDQTGLSFDAARNSLSEMENQLREVIRLKVLADNPDVGVRSASRDDVLVNKGTAVFYTDLATSLKIVQKLRDSEAKSVVATLATIEEIAPKEAEILKTKILQAKTSGEVLTITANTAKQFTYMTERYKELGETATEFSQSLNRAIPKATETAFTSMAKQMKEIQLSSAKLSANTTNWSKEVKGLGEQVLKLSSSDLYNIRNLALTSGQPFAGKDLSSFNKVLEARNKVSDIEVQIAKLTMEQAKQYSLQNQLSLTFLKIRRDTLVQSLGQIFKVGGASLQVATDLIEEAERQLQIKRQELDVLSKSIDLSSSLLKIEQEIAKSRRDAAAYIARGGTSSTLNSIESETISRIESLKAAKDELAVYKKTLNDKRLQITLTADLESREAKRIISLRAEEQLQGQSFKTEVERLKAKSALMSATTGEIGVQNAIIDKIIANRDADLKLLEAEGDKLSTSVHLEGQMLNSLSNGLLARQQGLQYLEEEIKYMREAVALQNSIGELRRSQEAQNAERNAFRTGIQITPLDRDRITIQQQQAAMDNIALEKLFLFEEHDAKLQLLDFERELAILELEARKAQYPEQAGIIDSLIDRRNSITEKQVEAQTNLYNLSNTEANLRYQSSQQLIDFLNEFPPLIRAVKELENQVTQGRLNFPGRVAGAMMPESMRGYMQGAADQAGGWNQLLANPEAFERAKQASEELARMDLIAQGLQDTFSALENGLSGAFEGIITGSKSAKQAFADLALGLLKAVAQMIAKMLAFQLALFTMDALFPGSGRAFVALMGGGVSPSAGAPPVGGNVFMPGQAGTEIPLANGGIMSRSQGLQGIVSKPTYLVGEGRYNEAVVPLPNGRSIPVQMHGASGVNNSVQVNVNISNEGNVQTETQGEDFNQLGGMIAAMINKKLQEEKMPGGILNKYGAS